jgi:type 1 glutamine amidotransferase
MSIIRKYLESGKPLVGIRTACHAFDTRGNAPPGHAEWPTFDPDVLGGHYTGHHANNLKPRVTAVQGAESHPIMAGVRTPFTGQWSLYKTGPLAASARALLLGEVAGQPVEPVAWVNLVGSSRVFYTSLGHPGDFDTIAFRRLLRNAVFWALNRQPSGGATATPTSVSRSVMPAVAGTAQAGLSPEQSLAAFRVPDDLQTELVLAEPIVRQPVSLSFDGSTQPSID